MKINVSQSGLLLLCSSLFISYITCLIALSVLEFEFSDVVRYLDYLNSSSVLSSLWVDKPIGFDIYLFRRLGVSLFLILLSSFNFIVQSFSEYGLALIIGFFNNFLLSYRLLFRGRYFACFALLFPLFLSFSYTNLRISLCSSILLILATFQDKNSRSGLVKTLNWIPIFIHLSSFALILFLEPIKLPLVTKIKTTFFNLFSFLRSAALKYYFLSICTSLILFSVSSSYLRTNTELGDVGATFSPFGVLFYFILVLVTFRSKSTIQLSSYFLLLLILYPFWRQGQQLLLASFPFWDSSISSSKFVITLCDLLILLFAAYSFSQNTFN